jgi:molecular chaperone HtpG
VATDFVGRDKLMPLLRFPSSMDGGLVSLADYVGRMKEDQEAIYYLLGEDLTSVASSPHLDYFHEHEIEVLYLVDPIDSFLVMSLQEYEDKALKNIDDADLELPKGKDAAAEGESGLEVREKDFDRLKERCVDVLGERITVVREGKLLTDSPCRLVSPEDAASREMQRVYRMLNQEFEVPKKILELNRRHPLIRNLVSLVVDRPDEPLINTAIEQLYENGLLIEGIHPNPAAMAPRIQSLLEAAVANVSEE